MPRHKRNKRHHTTRKTRNASNIAHYMEGYPAGDTEFSERLSLVLDYLAINEHVLELKRKRMFSKERVIALIHNAFGINRRTYIFGSQIEGTTTYGMMSDEDHLQRLDSFSLFLDSENPPLQPLDSKVVIKVSTNGCASQYCVLTMIEPSTQASRLKQLDPDRSPFDTVTFCQWDWTTTDGMIPNTIVFDTLNKHPVMFELVKRHVPAEQIWNTDIVYACYCKSVPKQCKFIFERPRPGHWPSEKMLKKTQKYGVFIVPQGPPKSTSICTYNCFQYQWRISTNLTERLLMLSLYTVHLKAYILTKMIRKELFVQEYQDRLSTFHYKTAFFFALEHAQPDAWREDNLIYCVKCILTTLRRFLTRRNCPHFTIANVNLFDGKIERHEFQKLVDKLTNVINSLQGIIENIQMDNTGDMLNMRIWRRNKRSIYCANGQALFYDVLMMCQGGTHFTSGIDLSRTTVKTRKALIDSDFTRRLETYYRAALEMKKYRKYAYELCGVMSSLACVFASACLEQKVEGHDYNDNGINKTRHLFKKYLESNIIGTYMRYASFLFCNGEYDEACEYFDLIEKQIEEDKKSNLIYQFCLSLSESLILQIAQQSCETSYKQRLSVLLIFMPEEAMCVPEFLRCEIFRGRFGTDNTSEFGFPSYDSFYCICVHIEHYLYYLQYLTYRELKQEHKQSAALMKLSLFAEIIKSRRCISTEADVLFLSCGFFDTSLNMLGHCFELEHKLELAWETYKTSLQILHDNNAAILHIIRIMWQMFQRLQT